MPNPQFSSEEISFLEKTIAAAKNSQYRLETLEAIEQFEKEDVFFLARKLGAVYVVKDGDEYLLHDYRLTADNIGEALWNNWRQQIKDAICGDSDAYKEERAKLQSSTENALIILIPLVLSALNIPPQASGVAIVLSLMILKIGLKTFCTTAGDLHKLRGKPGQICSATGRYMNFQEGRTEIVFKGTRFPKAPSKSEWFFFEEVVEES
jgi:hypothetical protein